MTALAVAVGLLAVLTLLNLFILLGVIRRLRTMSSAAEPQLDLLPALGSRVGTFALTGTDGRAVNDGDLANGQTLVLLMSPSCEPCRKSAARLAERREQLPERTLVLLRDDIDDIDDIDEPGHVPMVELLAGVGTIARFTGDDGIEGAFASGGYPTALLVEDGVVIAAALDFVDVLPDRVTA